MERGRLTGRLVIATHNAGKLREFDELFQSFDVLPIGAAVMGLEEPEENGIDLSRQCPAQGASRRARVGAHFALRQFGAVRRGPRWRARHLLGRWAGPTKDFGSAMARVESELKARAAPPPWRASFVSVLALAWPDGADETFEGRVDGILVFPPRGTAGFGYDPIFRPDGHHRTFGEMSAEEKHGIPADGSLALSHRARAFQAFPRARL